MKRSEAIKAIDMWIADRVFNEVTIDSLLSFIEKEIGMQPPVVMYKDLGFKKSPLYLMGENNEVSGIYAWEPETSDREREFQSKKDSCI